MRGVECPVIPPVHWKGVALPRQRSSRTLKTLSNCKGIYSVFSAVERYLYLRDFFYNFASLTSWTDQRDEPAGQTSSFYLKPWPVRIFKDFPFSLYIVAASESDKGLVKTLLVLLALYKFLPA